MPITIDDKIEIIEVDIRLSYEDAQLIKRVVNTLGVLDAIKVLRFGYPKCGLIQAKTFVETLKD